MVRGSRLFLQTQRIGVVQMRSGGLSLQQPADMGWWRARFSRQDLAQMTSYPLLHPRAATGYSLNLKQDHIFSLFLKGPDQREDIHERSTLAGTIPAQTLLLRFELIPAVLHSKFTLNYIDFFCGKATLVNCLP